MTAMNLKLVFISVLVSFIYFGCSSKETVKKDDGKRTETITKTPEKKLLNYEMRERELIKSNKVRTIEKIRFVYDKSGKPARESKVSTTEYDRNGFPMKAIFYDNKDKLKNSFTYKYDKSGNRIETIQLNDDNTPQYRFTYDYDRNGNKIKSTRLSSNGVMESYYTYEYDDENNLIKENWYNASGKKDYSIEYKYEDGKKTESYSYDEKGNKLFRYVYKYDSKGNVVEEVQYDGSNPLTVIQYVYKY